MAEITIDWRNFIAGESTADTVPDKGFSPDSYGLNLTKTRGLLYFTETATQLGSAVLTGDPIAYCYDPAYLGKDLMIMDDDGSAINFYTLSGTTLVKSATTTDAAREAVLGTSDFLPYNGSFFATSNANLIKLDANLALVDAGYWGMTNTSGFRHPLEVVEDELFIGDKNLIHIMTSATASSATDITLPSEVNITSLRRHPDGRHLLAFCGETTNYSHGSGNAGRVFVVNPLIRDWEQEIRLETQVEGSRLVGGTIYVTYGKNIGYFNGNGITFLKRLTTSATSYSHSMGNMDDILLIRDGTNCLAYGDLGAGKIWWNIYRDALTLRIVANKGGNVIVFGGGTTDAGTLYQVNYDNAGTAGKFYGNKMYFPDYSNIRRIDVLHDTQTGTNYFTLSHRDYTNTEQQFFISNPDVVSATWNKYRVATDIKDDFFQLVVTPSSGGTQHGYKFFRIFYDSI